MFVGRKTELEILREFRNRSTAGLIVCYGRRRIGKSRLIEEFAKGTSFFEFYGLAPRENISKEDQLKNFGELLGTYFNIPAMHFENWNEALSTLAAFTAKGRVIVLLDEISWMATGDKDFAGKLKGIWDSKFKKNTKLILILCGSVSSWIEKNILNDKGFMGRVSLTLNIEELPLIDANLFWEKAKFVSTTEKFKMLCVTGGVPRYLEEININKSAEQNLKRMCFSKEGLLFNEFDKIFNDVFGKQAENYKKIISHLSYSFLTLNQLCKSLHIKPTGSFSESLRILETSGFLSRDFAYKPNGTKSLKSRYRLKDNYLRFYLRYVEPNRDKIAKGLYDFIHLENLSHWESIFGYQFENLVINNLNLIIQLLRIPKESILSASSYFQNRTNRLQSCQIDLLIHAKFSLYVCEIKFKKLIPLSIIDEVSEKIKKLKFPKHLSIRPVLIYHGELAKGLKEESFFSELINFEKFLGKN